MAHQCIATALFDCALHGRWQETSDDIRFYCLRYLLKHLSILGRADDVYALIESTNWRMAKIELDPSRYALVQDVELAVHLSRDALAAGISKQEPVQRIFSLLAPFHTNPRPGVRIVALASCGKTSPLSGSEHRAR